MAESQPFPSPLVSVVIPARNEGSHIEETVRSVSGQAPGGLKIEVIVVDDGSTDDTAARAREGGATVIQATVPGSPGNPGAARNRGASVSTGDPIIFLDADCIPAQYWLEAILSAHRRGATVVGGSLAMPGGLSFTARCDYYCSMYLIHPRRPAGRVPHHPPAALSVRRETFFKTAGFSENPPLSHANEERAWEAEIQCAGDSIAFHPEAVAYHRNRPGLANLLRRNYRWGYTAIESKSQSGSARLAWIYRFPPVLILAAPLLAVAHTVFILGCWVRAGRWEPVMMLPWIFASRIAYVLGMVVGGVRWMGSRGDRLAGSRPVPRW